MNGLSLRAVEPLDADFMYAVDNDRDAWKYSNTVAPLSRQLLRTYAMEYDADPYKSGNLRLIVIDNESKPVGIADLFDISALNRRANIGIYILPEFRNRKFGLAALTLLTGYARDILMLNRLFAYILASNVQSAHLFAAAGFDKIATLPQWCSLPGGEYADVYLFTLKL